MGYAPPCERDKETRKQRARTLLSTEGAPLLFFFTPSPPSYPPPFFPRFPFPVSLVLGTLGPWNLFSGLCLSFPFSCSRRAQGHVPCARPAERGTKERQCMLTAWGGAPERGKSQVRSVLAAVLCLFLAGILLLIKVSYRPVSQARLSLPKTI